MGFSDCTCNAWQLPLHQKHLHSLTTFPSHASDASGEPDGRTAQGRHQKPSKQVHITADEVDIISDAFDWVSAVYDCVSFSFMLQASSSFCQVPATDVQSIENITIKVGTCSTEKSLQESHA